MWMLKNVTSKVEQNVIPQNWTANYVTVIGNIGMYMAGFTFVYTQGVSFEPDEYPPSWIFFMAAFCLQWFSWFDMMDGQRAKRLKCGTPIGRLIDEAGDTIQYTLAAMIATYGMRLSPGWILLLTGASNLTYFAIEMSYIFTGCLDLSAESLDDFGPVEIELTFSIVFVLFGLFGSNSIT